MNIIIFYTVGFFCLVLPKYAAEFLSWAIHNITRHKHGPMSEDQREVRPIFAMIVGIVVLFMTYAVDSKSKTPWLDF